MKSLKNVVLKRVGEETEFSGVSYSKEALESIHNQIQENKGRFLGEFIPDHSDFGVVHIKDAVLVVENSQFDGEELLVDLKFFKEDLPLDELTPSIRAWSTITDDVVQGDVKLIGIDLHWKDDE